MDVWTSDDSFVMNGNLFGGFEGLNDEILINFVIFDVFEDYIDEKLNLLSCHFKPLGFLVSP